MCLVRYCRYVPLIMSKAPQAFPASAPFLVEQWNGAVNEMWAYSCYLNPNENSLLYPVDAGESILCDYIFSEIATMNMSMVCSKDKSSAKVTFATGAKQNDGNLHTLLSVALLTMSGGGPDYDFNKFVEGVTITYAGEPRSGVFSGYECVISVLPRGSIELYKNLYVCEMTMTKV